MFYRFAFVVSIIFLSFIAGGLFTFGNDAVRDNFRQLYMFISANYENLTEDRTNQFHGNLWFKARNGPDKRGVTVYNKARAYDGLTFFTDQGQTAYLMTMDGEVLHKWHAPFSKVWGTTSPQIPRPVPDHLVNWRKALLMPNGDIFVVYEGMSTTPYGYGLAKLDKYSNVLWKYSRSSHHDVKVAEDGRVYVYTHSIEKKVPKGVDTVRPPIIHDYLTILSPDGKEEKRISLLKAFRDSEFSSFLDFPNQRKGDITHANAIEFITEDTAKKYPFLKKGQVLLSILGFSALAVLDVETEKIVWAVSGIWRRQHDPDWLENGNILLFDNHGHRGVGGRTRVLEFNPLTQQIVWQYTGTNKQPFISVNRGSQQRLPNGNTLVTESTNGRLFEVTRDKKIVWEYLNPSRGGENDSLVGILCWAVRVNPSTLYFLNKP